MKIHIIKNLNVMVRSQDNRNRTGRIVVFTRAGGGKKNYKKIDFWKKLKNIPAKILTIEPDAFRNAYVSLICYKTGLLSYIISSYKSEIGDIIISSNKFFNYGIGDTLLLCNIKVGATINNIELYPGNGSKLCRAAGTFAKILKSDKIRGFSLLKLSSGEERLISHKSCATIGMVSNKLYRVENVYFKAGIKKNLGFRSKVRGIAKNPVDHPNGGKNKRWFSFCW